MLRLSCVSPMLATFDFFTGKRPTENNYPCVLALKHETCLQSENIALFSNAVLTYSIGKGEASSVFRVLHLMKQVGYSCCYLLQRRLLNWTKPLHTSLLLGTIMDLS